MQRQEQDYDGLIFPLRAPESSYPLRVRTRESDDQLADPPRHGVETGLHQIARLSIDINVSG